MVTIVADGIKWVKVSKWWQMVFLNFTQTLEYSAIRYSCLNVFLLN